MKYQWGADDSFLIGFLSAINSLSEIFFNGNNLNFLIFGFYEVHLVKTVCGDYLCLISTSEAPANRMNELLNRLDHEFNDYSINCEFVDSKYNTEIEEKFYNAYKPVLKGKIARKFHKKDKILARKEALKIQRPVEIIPIPAEGEEAFDEIAYLKRKIKRKTAKLRASKILAKNIEHALNNVFTSILGKIALLKMDLNSNSKLFISLKELNEYITKAASLSSQYSNILKSFKEYPDFERESDILSIESEPKTHVSELSTPDLRGKGRILIMDDEEMIRETMVKYLKKMGYQVEGVANGEQAIDLYKRALDIGRKYNVVFLDLIIREGLGGKETVERLKKLDRSVNAVLISGMVHDPIVKNYKEYGFRELVGELNESIRD